MKYHGDDPFSEWSCYALMLFIFFAVARTIIGAHESNSPSKPKKQEGKGREDST